MPQGFCGASAEGVSDAGGVPDGVDAVHVGNPVRQAILDRAAAPYAAPDGGPLRLLVIGGSQGARVLSQTVPAAVAELPRDIRARLQVSHQARAEDVAAVAAAYAAAGVVAEVQPFFSDVPERMARCHVIVSRAGASSLAEITVIGRPAILIPFAAATGDHQSANARALAESDAAVVLPESVLDISSLTRDLNAILTDAARASAMASAALSMGRPDAAARLYDLVTEISS